MEETVIRIVKLTGYLAALAGSLLLMGSSPAEAQETEKTTGSVEVASPDGAKNENTPPTLRRPLNSVRFGAEYYYGMSNFFGGWMRTTDAVWAGRMTFAPSNLNLNWNHGDRYSARFAVGIGDAYNGRRGLMDRTTEAYISTRSKAGDSFTIGKFFTPFSTNEWQYETKYGVMAQGVRGAYNFTASVQAGGGSKNASLYMRLGRQMGQRTSLGVSGGLGRGLSYGSSHNALFGADLSHDFNGIRLTSEYMLGSGPNGPFQFFTGRIAFTNLGRFQPYIGLYTWRDAAGEMGNFRSQLVGMSYQLTPLLTLDMGAGNTPGRGVFWFQTRTAF